MKKIVFGVTGSIAAYKACELVRMLVRGGNEVKVVMTEAAARFVTPLTFRTLSRNQVYTDQFAEVGDWKVEHISLADADVVVVAPATANIIAKMRYGLADDLLSSVLLATRARIVVAPAMNSGMWENPATCENIRVLRERGVTIVEPEAGELACGVEGKGRLAEIDRIFAAVKS